jgi:hypothetical protein
MGTQVQVVFQIKAFMVMEKLVLQMNKLNNINCTPSNIANHPRRGFSQKMCSKWMRQCFFSRQGLPKHFL